jgi:hypothetical protein
MSKKLTAEEVLARGAKYTNRKSFGVGDQSAYKLALRMGIIDQLYPSRCRDWSDDDAVIAEGKKYTSRSAFEAGSNPAYHHARRRGLLDILYPKMRKDWSNDDAVLVEGRKYASRSEFQKQAGAAYRVARKRKLLDQLYPSKYGDWSSDAAVIAEGLKYSTRSDFHRHSLTAFEAASSRGLLDKILPVSLERTDNDAIYIWRAVGQHYNGNPVYKIGVTSTRLGTVRINHVAKGSGFEFDLICCEPVVCKATELERKLHLLGENPNYTGFSGCTEFRALSDSALYVAISMICGAM